MSELPRGHEPSRVAPQETGHDLLAPCEWELPLDGRVHVTFKERRGMAGKEIVISGTPEDESWGEHEVTLCLLPHRYPITFVEARQSYEGSLPITVVQIEASGKLPNGKKLGDFDVFFAKAIPWARAYAQANGITELIIVARPGTYGSEAALREGFTLENRGEHTDIDPHRDAVHALHVTPLEKAA